MKVSVMDMMKSEEEIYLPEDMIFEILTRLSKSSALDSCKLISKSWTQLVTCDPDFMSLWCNRTKNLSGYIIQAHDWRRNIYVSTIVSLDGRKIKICSDDDKMKLLASCHQGICCYEKVNYNYKKNRWFACKPATQQFQPLPNPKLKFQTDGVGIKVLRSNPLRYKIVRLSSHKIGRQYVCEIFDSESWSWRWINGVCFDDQFDSIIRSLPAVSIDMSLYWQTHGGNVLKFDVCLERATKFKLPVPPSDWSCEPFCICNRELFEYEGNLGFCGMFCEQGKHGFSSNICGGSINLWVLQQGDEGWMYRGGIDMSSVFDDLHIIEYVSFCTTQIMFIKTSKQAFFYRLDRQLIITQLDLDYGLGFDRDRYISPDRVFQFRSDLHMVNLKSIVKKNNSRQHVIEY